MRLIPPQFRRGSIFLPVLFVGMIVAVLCLGGSVAVRAVGRQSQLRTDVAEARSLAYSGIEAARAIIAADSSWRTNRSNGTWLSNVSLGGGKFSVSVVNPSGALNRNSTDAVTITGTGVSRSATFVLTATYGQNSPTPLTMLSASAGAEGAVTFSSATVKSAGQVISTNASMSASLVGCSIAPDVEANLTILGLGFSGKVTALAAKRSYPDSTVFDYYTTNGTAITYSSLPSGQSGRIIDRQLLSPKTNPFGSLASNGIYIIDCGGGKLTIQDSRLVCCLVVRNASLVVVQNSINWTASSTSLPALIVEGPLQLAYTATTLNESLGVNFNPANNPYPWTSTATNTTQTDTYPSAITSLVFATGNITTSNSVAVDSLYTNASLSVSGTLTLTTDFRYSSVPAPGFTDYNMGIVPGSYR